MSRLGLEPSALALTARTTAFTEWPDFWTVSPFDSNLRTYVQPLAIRAGVGKRGTPYPRMTVCSKSFLPTFATCRGAPRPSGLYQAREQ